MPRRLVLRAGLAGSIGGLLVGCSGSAPARVGDALTPRRTERYGDRPRQNGEWTFPREGDGRLPVVVLLHGGYWQQQYGPSLERPVARAAARRGHAVWNVDYRTADVDYPATFLDAAAALDHLRVSRHADRLDLDRVAVVGHSAGGHLALWLASRGALPAGAPGAPVGDAVRPRLVVGQAPVADLIAGARAQLGGGAVETLMDGTPASEPARYAVSSPQQLLPLPVAHRPQVLLVHGTDDDVVPVAQSRDYVAAARAVGTLVALRELAAADHMAHLDPGSSALRPVWRALAGL